MPLKLSVHYHASCVLNLFYGGLLPGKRDKKKKKERKGKRERETTTTMDKMILPETRCHVH